MYERTLNVVFLGLDYSHNTQYAPPVLKFWRPHCIESYKYTYACSIYTFTLGGGGEVGSIDKF